MDVETDPKSDAQVYYLSSLQYDIPAKPKPGEKAKPQTSDQVCTKTKNKKKIS